MSLYSCHSHLKCPSLGRQGPPREVRGHDGGLLAPSSQSRCCLCLCVCVFISTALCVQVAKLLSELDIVRRNIDIMNEIMNENQPGQESPDDYQLLEVRGGGARGRG